MTANELIKYVELATKNGMKFGFACGVLSGAILMLGFLLMCAKHSNRKYEGTKICGI